MTAMRRWRQPQVAIAVMIVVALGCEDHATRGMAKGRVPGLAPELITFSESSKVRSAKTPEIERLTYRLETPYPAQPVIEAIARQLTARGWRPLRNNFFIREEQSEYVGGWIEYHAASSAQGPKRYVCRWWAQWVRDDGAVVDYVLTYSSKSEQFTNRSSLDVSASKMTRTFAKQLFESNPNNDPARLVHTVPVGTQPNWRVAPSSLSLERKYEARKDAGN